MNSLKKLALLLVAFFGIISSSMAQTKVCVPVNMVIANTVTSCGQGYTGSKFKRSIVTCPDGKITTSDWDTTQCVSIGGYTPPTACQLNPVLCAGTPSPSGCPPGKHWSMKGLSYAHCVSNDYACPWGTTLQHDALGNATTCLPNTCPSNQVLQSDGISCACPGSLPIWNGTMCTAPVCLNHSGPTYTSSCPSGQTGQIVQQDTIDCNGAVLSTATISNTCSLSCPATSTVYSACPSGQVGQAKTTTSYTVINGACSPNSTTDLSGCSVAPVSCPGTSTSFGACPPNTTGNSVITTTYSGPSCTPNTTTDYSKCVAIQIPTQSCPNGATDWPTCTPQTCSDAYGGEHVIGDVITLCDATGQGGAVRYDATVVCTKQIVGPGAYWKLSYSGKEPYQNGCPQNPG